MRTLDTLLKENGEYGRRITYLKVDVEGYEIACLKQWLKSGVVNFIDQLGIEMHTGPSAYMNGVLKGMAIRVVEFSNRGYKTRKIFA